MSIWAAKRWLGDVPLKLGANLLFSAGTLAARPAVSAGSAAAEYQSTDTGAFYKSDGTNWLQIGYLVDARLWGTLALDGNGSTDVSSTNGSNQFTSATANWKAGQTLVVRGAGAAGATFVGTIASVAGTTATCGVGQNAGTTAANLTGFWGTDDTTAWNNGLASAPVGSIIDAGPSFRSLCTGNLSVPAGVKLLLDGRGPFDPQTNPFRTAAGPTFGMVQNATTFVNLAGVAAKLGDGIFYSLNQLAPTASTPTTTFGYVVTVAQGQAGCKVGNIYAPNAYLGVDVESGRTEIGTISIGALSAALKIDHSMDFVNVECVRHEPFWAICEGLSPAPSGTNFSGYALGNANTVLVYRADSFHIGRIQLFQGLAPILMLDSPDGTQNPKCGYGQVDQIDADTVAYGPYAFATQSPGLQIGLLITAANGTGFGVAGQTSIYLLSGGSLAPLVKVADHNPRGTWANGIVVRNAGTLVSSAQRKTSGALSTVALTSGTAAKIDDSSDRFLVVPVTFNPSAIAAATCQVQLSPDGTTFSTLVTKSFPATLVAGTVEDVAVQVPQGWQVKLTVNAQATLGTGTFY